MPYTHNGIECRAPSDGQAAAEGEARYDILRVNRATNHDAAWYYPDPKPAAANVKDHVTFWRGVAVVGGNLGGE